MQKQKIIIIIGVVLALSGVLLINTYVQQREQEIKSQAKKTITKIQTNQTAVLVAKKDIPRGSIVDPDMFESSIVPNQYLVPQAVTSLDRIDGMLVKADISKGEQISLSKLSRSKEADKDSLSAATPAGKRAITISVDNVASLAGMVRPRDYVDVIATLPVPVTTAEGKQVSQMAVVPLFQNVLVLAIGQNLGRAEVISAEGRYDKDKDKEIKKEASPYVTLALSPEEANLLAFVQEQGKLRLTLRSPIDSNIQPIQPASWETVFQYIMPKTEAVKEAPKKEEDAGPSIEIYRGLKKERIPISKG